MVLVRTGKQHKQREVPLHDSTVTALSSYVRLRDARCPQPTTPAFFLSARGGRVGLSRARTRRSGAQAAAGRSCGPVVFVDESAEYRSSVDGRSQVDYSDWLVVGCLLLSTLVRAMLVVVRLPRGQNAT